MNEKRRVLTVDIEADDSQIAKIYQRLAAYETPLDEDKTIVVGYYLHNLYTAFEHICLVVAEAFENQISDRSQWHSLLLRRMTLDIEGMRPRLFRDETYRYIDELRRFRHVFRSAYSITLDPQRMEMILALALELRSLYQEDMRKFREFLSQT